MPAGLPDYIASAKPNPMTNRAPWYTNTAQTYAGIMLWFVFWHEVPMGSGLKGADGYSEFMGGTLAHGIGIAILGLIIAALICHFLFYVVPGMLGMKTGLPLYIVGTSTYGATGGFLMPGFLMGLLQFGWLSVNAYFSSLLLVAPFFEEGIGAAKGSPAHMGLAAIWAVLAAIVGLKGIQYVARIASFLPLIPLVILIVLLVSTIGGVGDFDPETIKTGGAQFIEDGEVVTEAKPALSQMGVILLICTYVVGFFATAGAAGADFGMNNRDGKDVQLGGIFGIALSTIFAGGLALLIVAGAHGMGKASDSGVLQATGLMGDIMGSKTGTVFWCLLAIAAFPPACFSSFIAANSFKTTLPKVNPLISCGLGTLVAIALAVSGWAGNAVDVFKIIGASFGPVCGAMAADYLLSGRKWAGPRAAFNPAGWISWIAGFVVGAADFIPPLAGKVPCPPVAAFVVGFVLYALLAVVGCQTKTLEMPAAEETGEAPAEA